MTQMISTPAEVEAFALEVDAALKAAFDGLAELEGRTAVITEELKEIWQKATETEFDDVSYGNWSLCSSLARSVENARYKLKNDRENAADTLVRWKEDNQRREDLRTEKAHEEAAKTAERIPSGIMILTAHVDLLKGKPTNTATVLYTLGDKILETQGRLDTNTGAMTFGLLNDVRPKSRVKDAEGRTTQRLFWAKMTAEDIGKAVDIRATVLDAARKAIEAAMPTKRRR